ncbi:hypothetical protein FRZ67_01205 [Panacibacter ginsenosidivorans]|uniref:Uncharacterized protein n=1 Tax=Panacibacter ginsenosidivorans TaxID=1813871 RepID=A0A5B8V482_9BACT|nr:DUF6266 family protein [Panacibacter ginsenosidivorans]QEC65989.1 hypothetical protein FRZ67_01205 [Panacibacter ginsenosidivorans]
MGTINKGILGGFSGTVGTVIGGSWKGIDYMRSQPSRKSGTTSQPQLEQQAKFSLIVKFLQSMTGLVMVTFHNYAVKMTGFNSALSYNIKNVITGTYPSYAIDYTKVLVSRGDLPNAGGPAAVAGTAGNINFTWTDNSGMGKAAATDNAVLVAYSSTMNLTIYDLEAATRNAAAATLNAATFSGETVEVYIGFMSEDGREVASSIYLGQVTVA